MKWIKGFLINLQFFTSIPIPIALPMDQGHLRHAIKTFPILGLFQGLLYALILFLLTEWSPFSALAIAFLLWLLTIVITGGIHLDGWMDASDAYFSYQSTEKRLEIMSDPRTGAFGVLSVLVLLSSRFLFIYEIIERVNLVSYLLIALIPFFSKLVMGMLLLTVPSAKDKGLAIMFQQAAKPSSLAAYPFYIVICIALLTFLDLYLIVLALILNLVALGCYFVIRAKVRRWFGGITGDVVGASVEGTEILLWMTVWLLHYFVMG
ncbi:adenosylcobinamide-GDP ribazoletransferase [Bacillus sp. 31A1R]|uniref:Adenosylcobinamide-GDP ribazoletransferase n=1 Tax=Robertmurraya mangrovi TaxID=3098077 RepID=A0ABU5J491_9BACI|nr:adenosylcobinamide-GDP ribazoletransferase [Bacillus sp. 31A1R]MDZ5474213.1 adenosylcobinamide-GDP ribazoletransferase [Bacillus sp. 31A1R]